MRHRNELPFYNTALGPAETTVVVPPMKSEAFEAFRAEGFLTLKQFRDAEKPDRACWAEILPSAKAVEEDR
jgi:hypothetical protein